MLLITDSCKLLVTEMKTQSMNTFVYWKSNFSRHSRFNVEYRYDVHNPWTRVPCSRPSYDHNASEEMSCLFLTCATTVVNPFYSEIYEIRLNAYENETTKCNSSTYLYEPALNSKFNVLFILALQAVFKQLRFPKTILTITHTFALIPDFLKRYIH